MREILQHTPRWVFGLLAALIVSGVMQSRTRRIPLGMALVVPVAMLVLSFSSVLQEVGWWWPALSAWLLSVSATSALFLAGMSPEAATYDADSRKLIVAGSWAPLGVFLGIFCVRYAIGAAKGMDLEIVRFAATRVSIGIALGALSGFFTARGLLFWRTHAAHRAAA